MDTLRGSVFAFLGGTGTLQGCEETEPYLVPVNLEKLNGDYGEGAISFSQCLGAGLATGSAWGRNHWHAHKIELFGHQVAER
jgi:hypothetical protein